MPPDGPLSYLEPIEKRSRGEAILDALARMIHQAGLGVGDRLPPEVRLAHQLGVGRSTIREALNRWEALGLIRRRRGDGTYLTASIPDADGPVPLMVKLEGEAILRSLEVRRTLERDVARLTAKRANPAQKAEIGRLAEDLLSIVASGQDYIAADKQFHEAICEATGNPLFGQILSRLNVAFDENDVSSFRRSAFGLASFPFHGELALAIERGDPEGAAIAVNGILDAVDAEVRQIMREGPPEFDQPQAKQSFQSL